MAQLTRQKNVSYGSPVEKCRHSHDNAQYVLPTSGLLPKTVAVLNRIPDRTELLWHGHHDNLATRLLVIDMRNSSTVNIGHIADPQSKLKHSENRVHL